MSFHLDLVMALTGIAAGAAVACGIWMIWVGQLTSESGNPFLGTDTTSVTVLRPYGFIVLAIGLVVGIPAIGITRALKEWADINALS